MSSIFLSIIIVGSQILLSILSINHSGFSCNKEVEEIFTRYYDDISNEWVETQGQHELNCLIREVPDIYAEKEKPMIFTRYYDDSIKEWIETQEIHDLSTRIRGMNAREVVEYSNSLQTDCIIDPAYEKTAEFKVAAKTIIRVMDDQRRGEVTDKPTIWQMVGAVAGGIVCGTVLSDIWSGSDGKGGIRQHL